MAKLRISVTQNVDSIVETAKVCYSKVDDCVSAFAAMTAKLVAVSENEMDIKDLPVAVPPPAPALAPCRDFRANNFDVPGKCFYGRIVGHKDRSPGAIYIWPSPWNAVEFVWCDITDQANVLYALKKSQRSDIDYDGQAEVVAKYNAKYFGTNCDTSILTKEISNI